MYLVVVTVQISRSHLSYMDWLDCYVYLEVGNMIMNFHMWYYMDYGMSFLPEQLFQLVTNYIFDRSHSDIKVQLELDLKNLKEDLRYVKLLLKRYTYEQFVDGTGSSGFIYSGRNEKSLCKYDLMDTRCEKHH